MDDPLRSETDKIHANTGAWRNSVRTMAESAESNGFSNASTAGKCTVSCRWLWMLSGSLRGKRLLKSCIFVLLAFLLFLWSRNISSNDVRSSRSLTLNTSFMMLPSSECISNTIFLVLLVTSSPGQFQTRNVIRQTWGSRRRVGGATAVTYFVLGHGRERQPLIEKENALHRDIIQADFHDTYYNLTRKVLTGLGWLCSYCPSAAFVMKTDTDMFVNTDYLLELLSRAPRSNFFTGFIYGGMRPIRQKQSRWYFSTEEYPGESYPPFCSGTGYVLSTDTACAVWNISRTAPLFKLEDVHVGLRLAELNIKPVPIHSKRVFFNGRVPFSICTYRRLVTSHHVDDSDKLLYWRGVMDSGSADCPEKT
ncbi:beta-1,3-galactosyltransferase 5-like isoform X2 [Hypanus sabinus]|uniref:beta-1,3-galactosyltransferase 5-like isoform X2 n=1 Tax=Hypanus sabinus TaxID=79690 RepID=UPI0028C45BA5|nr:beta-1,3-galactosyltransferase 5-like isoform X2 [Hypanus sabinus]